VNGRPVKDRVLQHAVVSGFETFLTKGAYPIAILYLNVDPAIVDVNVHPTKREVRFENGGMVHDFVKAAVRKAITTRQPGVEGVSDALMRFEGRRLAFNEEYGTKDVGRETWDVGRGTTGEGRTGWTQEITSNVQRPTSNVDLRPLGQLNRTYIVCEDKEGSLVLIDQHAAHERLGFDELKKQLAKGSIEQQRLLLPEQLKLTPKELSIIIEHLSDIERTGFELEPFGGKSVVVKACPSLLGDVSLQHLFERIAQEIADYGSFGATDEVIDKILAIIACHRQVRAGDVLSQIEMEVLIRDLETSGTSHCPHGRPAVVTIERSEVEKWFKRT
jgi:DNA mismatch repair protein MutL